jgi:hypothetical protein
MGLGRMGRTYKRPAIKQHKDLLEDEQYRPAAIDTKRRKVRDKKLSKRELEEALNDGYHTISEVVD